MNILKITKNKLIHQKVNKFANSLKIFNGDIIFIILSFLKRRIKNDYHPIDEYISDDSDKDSSAPEYLDFSINEDKIKVNWIQDDDGNRLELQRIKSKRGDYIFSKMDEPEYITAALLNLFINLPETESINPNDYFYLKSK